MLHFSVFSNLSNDMRWQCQCIQAYASAHHRLSFVQFVSLFYLFIFFLNKNASGELCSSKECTWKTSNEQMYCKSITRQNSAHCTHTHKHKDRLSAICKPNATINAHLRYAKTHFFVHLFTECETHSISICVSIAYTFLVYNMQFRCTLCPARVPLHRRMSINSKHAQFVVGRLVEWRPLHSLVISR